MKRLLTLFAVLAMGGAQLAYANPDLQKIIDDPNQWAIQTGDYANQRYSKLDQINKDNVGKMQVAWTFSTGVLRGHEGSPLVIGDMMYVHAPFPNTVFALDLSKEGQIVWKYEPKQDADVIPLPGRLRRVVVKLVSRGWMERRQASSGGFLFLTARSPFRAGAPALN